MISFITGKPGGGKGLLSMQQIVDELVQGKRHVICNTPVRLQPWIFGDGRAMIGLKSYLLRKHGKDFDCENRVHVLDDDQIASFFLWRVVDGKLVKAEAQVQKKGDGDERLMGFDTSLAAASGGVLYVVDEAWKFYSARSWQKTGEATLFYAAQHRHFGDDVLIVTQHTKQIDPAIQRVAQDFWVVTNHSKLTMGMFRQPDIFSVAIYDQAPTGGQLKPMSRKVFKLDKGGLAQTYDTSAGVGLTGRMAADTSARRKGLPWWGLFLLVFSIGLVVWKIPVVLGWAFGHQLRSNTPQSPPKHESPASASKPKPASFFPGLDSAQPDEVAHVSGMPQGDTPDDTNGVVCIGYAAFGKDATAWFSDGSAAYSDAGELTLIEKHWVTAWGRRYRVIVGQSVSRASENQDVRSRNENQDYYSQPQDYNPSPVNQVTVLNPIRSQISDIPPTPRINGIANMASRFQSQSPVTDPVQTQ